MIRFHLASGTRLALRGAVPLAGGIVVAIGMSPDPGRTFEAIAIHSTTLRFPGSPAPAVILALCLAISFHAAGRLSPGIRGWLRHLPVSSRSHLWSFFLALAAAQAPILAAWSIAWVYGLISGIDVSLLRLASMPLIGASAAVLTLPAARRAATVLLAAPAAVLSIIPSWTGLPISAVLIAGAFLAASGIALPGRTRVRKRLDVPPAYLPLLTMWRALGWRIAGAFLAGSLPLPALWLFTRNNDLTGKLLETAGRFAAGICVSLLLAYMILHLSVRRPAWPWARSLPVNCARRVRQDTCLLLAHMAPVAAGAWLILPPSPGSAAAVIALAVLLALRGARALRTRKDTPVGSTGPLLLESLFLSVCTAITPLATAAWLILIPPAYRSAVTGEREVGIFTWVERHHGQAGDSLSWSDR